MSRAFVKDSDDDLAAGELPERPLSAHPNYVTPQGLEQLQGRLRELQEQHERLAPQAPDDSQAKQALRVVERDLRYFNAQLERAIVVDLHGQPRDEVHFGAQVQIRDEDGKTQRFTIVGDDEADVAAGRISWASPLAKAMMGAHVGDTVTWSRPAGDAELEIVEIKYPEKRD
jgi:transcription elongation factor GreB